MRKLVPTLAIGLIAALATGPTVYAYALQNAPYTFTAQNGEAITLTLVRYSKPPYTKQAIVQGLHGCIRVKFHLDAFGRPNRLQVDTSYLNGLVNPLTRIPPATGGPIRNELKRDVIRTMAKWQFRVTGANGGATTVPPAAFFFQDIIFKSHRGNPTFNTHNWICFQRYANALIVTRAAATATQPLRILPENKKPVDRVLLAVPQGTTLPNGWVNVTFCVSTQGKAVHAKVTGASPRGLYDKAAVAALKTWSFRARSAHGKNVGTCGLKDHIPVFGADFLAKRPAVLNQRPTALQSADLWPKGEHVPNSGKVTLTFCVEADGSVDRAKVTQAKPSSVFDKAALKVLQAWQYWPRMVNGKPAATCNVQTTIRFRHAYQRLVWAESAT